MSGDYAMEVEESRSESIRIRLVEYQVLRAEILNRLEGQRLFLSLAIIALGTLFIVSIQSTDSSVGALLMLGYPILCLFLAIGWGHHDRRIAQIGLYIKNRIEEPLRKNPSG